jgi:hypothetical protein
VATRALKLESSLQLHRLVWDTLLRLLQDDDEAIRSQAENVASELVEVPDRAECHSTLAVERVWYLLASLLSDDDIMATYILQGTCEMFPLCLR